MFVVAIVLVIFSGVNQIHGIEEPIEPEKNVYPVVVPAQHGPFVAVQSAAVGTHQNGQLHDGRMGHDSEYPQWNGPSTIHPQHQGGNRYGQEQDYHDENSFKGFRNRVEFHGYPPGKCGNRPWDTKSCHFYVMIERDVKRGKAIFTLSGILDNYEQGYVAVGLSDDTLMGSDDIVECLKVPNSPLQVHHSWANFHAQPVRQKFDEEVVKPLPYFYKISIETNKDRRVANITCVFERPLFKSVHYVVDGKEFNIDLDLSKEKKFNILLATGQLQQDAIYGYVPAKHQGYIHNSDKNRAFASSPSNAKIWLTNGSRSSHTGPSNPLIIMVTIYVMVQSKKFLVT